MTGVLSRFRNWLGSLFGGEDADDTDADADEPRIEGDPSTVTHRDDRPLETPDVPPSAAESASPAADGSQEGPTDPEGTRDAGATPASSADTDTSVGPGPVSIPDAESSGEPPSEPGPSPEDGGTDAATAPEDPVSGPRDGDGPGATAAEDASGFECAVCGTAVEDPAHSCPLCRSTEVVPATESPERGP